MLHPALSCPLALHFGLPTGLVFSHLVAYFTFLSHLAFHPVFHLSTSVPALLPPQLQPLAFEFPVLALITLIAHFF